MKVHTDNTLTVSSVVCREGLVFGGRGITWIKVRLQVREAVGKVTEGVQFFTRGIRLLGSDCNNCGRLFYRAALGELSELKVGIWFICL